MIEWRPEESPNYDEVLGLKSAEELDLLLGGTRDDKVRFFKDPRDVHRRLYSALTLPEHPEYAGTFRGTPGTSLETRRVAGLQIGEGAAPAEFADPKKVSGYFGLYLRAVDELVNKAEVSSDGHQLEAATRLFYVFGLWHPFLDGNGHIQRLIFAVAVDLCDKLTLNGSWTIHPRPYDIEIAEAFNRAGSLETRIRAIMGVLVKYVSFSSS